MRALLFSLLFFCVLGIQSKEDNIKANVTDKSTDTSRNKTANNETIEENGSIILSIFFVFLVVLMLFSFFFFLRIMLNRNPHKESQYQSSPESVRVRPLLIKKTPSS